MRIPFYSIFFRRLGSFDTGIGEVFVHLIGLLDDLLHDGDMNISNDLIVYNLMVYSQLHGRVDLYLQIEAVRFLFYHRIHRLVFVVPSVS